MKFQTQFNRASFMDKRYHKAKGISKTIPDQAMSVREIIERSVRGLPTTGARVPVYLGDDHDLPDVEKMDLIDIHNARQEAQQTVNEIQEKLQKPKKRSQPKPELPLPPTSPETATPPQGT